MASASHNPTIEFDDSLEDEKNVKGLFAGLVVFTTLIVLSTTARNAIRLWNRSAGICDVFSVIGLAFNLAGNSLEFLSIHKGFGRHLQFLSLEEELNVRKLVEYTLLLAFISVWAVQMTVGFFILTLIRDAYRRSQWVCYGLIALTTAATLANGIVWGFQARPIDKLWKPELPGTIAPARQVILEIIIFSAINLVSDLFFALSPVYFFGRLQMDLKKKITILTLTGSGLLVVISASFRLIFVDAFADPDFTWALPTVYTATIIERNFAQFIADMPILYPVLRKLFEKARHSIKLAGRTTDSQFGSLDHSERGNKVIVTIGSAGKRGPKNRHFTELGSAISEDEIYLRNIGRSREDTRYESGGDIQEIEVRGPESR